MSSCEVILRRYIVSVFVRSLDTYLRIKCPVGQNLQRLYNRSSILFFGNAFVGSGMVDRQWTTSAACYSLSGFRVLQFTAIRPDKI